MAEKKTFKFKNPNTGIVSEYNDTPYFRKMTARIQKKYDNLSAKDKETIRKRIAKREERAAAQDKLRKEVSEGRAAGLSMHEIRAKRMNISPEELSRRNLATVLGMAEGMSLFLPAGAAIKAGQLVYKGLKGAKAAKALRAAANANKAAKTAKPASNVRASRPSVKADRPKLKSDRKVRPSTSSTTGKPSTAPKPKPTATATKPAVKPKPTQATTTKTTGKPTASAGRGNVKANRPSVRADRKSVRAGRVSTKAAPKNLKPGTRVVKPKPKPTSGAKKARRGVSPLLPAGAAILGGAVAVDRSTKGRDQARAGGRPTSGPTTRGSRRPKSADKPRRTSGPSTRGSRRPPSKDKKIPPLTKPSDIPSTNISRPRVSSSTVSKSGAAAKRMPTPTTQRRASGPATRGSAKRGATARITAGPNVGFGPKGNIFPKDAADRRRLMAKYGGTGSAAAKAAAAGKQGNMKKGSK